LPRNPGANDNTEESCQTTRTHYDDRDEEVGGIDTDVDDDRDEGGDEDDEDDDNEDDATGDLEAGIRTGRPKAGGALTRAAFAVQLR
jgi:hypothetical protein